MKQVFVTIVALSVDSQNAVLYLADGNTMTIPQGDPRLPEIVAVAKEPLSKNEPVEVDVTPRVAERTEYGAAEKGTGGLVKFFRVAKQFVKDLLDTDSPDKVTGEAAHVSPLEVGMFPGQEPKPEAYKERADEVLLTRNAENHKPEVAPEPELTNDQKIDMASQRMEQLMGAGKGTDHADFHKPLDEKVETIVAVNTQTGSIIPEAQNLARQLKGAEKLKNYTGFTNFLKRLELIIKDRAHSVEDLMKFIAHGDLPIADDGCIVIYKRLARRGDYYVDVHTKNIRQKVGSYVFLLPGLVDPNRRRDCSNGLHVASLSYLSSFSGDVTVVAKVRPEDVFAVPEYSHNKMRVSGYHILVELPQKLANLVNSGKSLSSDPDGAVILGNVIAGNHVRIKEHVEVGGNHGTNVKITAVDVSSADKLAESPLLTGETLDMEAVLEASVPVAPAVNANDLAPAKPEKETNVVKKSKTKTKAKAKAKPAKVGNKSPAFAQAMNDLEAAQTIDVASAAAQKLLKMKSGAKKGWDKLGFTTSEVNQIMGSLPKQTNERADKIQADNAQAEKRKENARKGGSGPSALIREMLDQSPLTTAQYQAIVLIKKKAKKGWQALGVTADEQAEIEAKSK